MKRNLFNDLVRVRSKFEKSLATLKTGTVNSVKTAARP
jgi:hypothetical protein